MLRALVNRCILSFGLKSEKNTKEVTGSFPNFCHFPRKAVRMPIWVGMFSPRLVANT